MKTIKVNHYPSLIYTDENIAKEEANKHKVTVCRIIYVENWNGETTEKFIGYGLYDEKLLESRDFISV